MLTLLSVLAFVDRQIFAVLLMPVKTEFALSDLQVGLVTGLGFALAFGLLALPLARVADRHERRSLVAWCRGVGGAAAALGALAGNAGLLLVSRAGAAVSDAGGMPASMSMVADLYPARQRAKAMGVLSMGASLGALIALVGGAWAAERFGWRATLAGVGLASVLAALLMRWVVQEPARSAPAAQSPGAAAANPSPEAKAAATAAQASPWRQVWSLPAARCLIGAAAFALLAGYAIGAWNFTYLVRSLSLSPQQAGWVAGVAALGSMLAAPLSGVWADRLARGGNARLLWVAQAGLWAALPLGWAYLALAAAGQATAAIAGVVVFAFCIGLWIAPVYAALSQVVPAPLRSTANASVMLAGAVGGGGIGPVLTGALSDAMGLVGRATSTDPLGWALAIMLSLLLPAVVLLARAQRAMTQQSTHALKEQR